ncbi:MAG: hypothetical protein JWM44_2103 [Bacilli bacterium]|nr:hypothetical protein [Bacilli bacterium]
MKMKFTQMLTALTALTFIVSANVVLAAGSSLDAKGQTAAKAFFDFVKGFSWWIFIPLLIILFAVKQQGSAQGDSGKEALATKGLWTLVVCQVGLQWGWEIYTLFHDLFA